jgi:hypothetical protein
VSSGYFRLGEVGPGYAGLGQDRPGQFRFFQGRRRYDILSQVSSCYARLFQVKSG